MQEGIRSRFAFIVMGLASLIGFTTPAHGQGYIFNQMAGWHGTLEGSPSVLAGQVIAQADLNGDGRLDFAVVEEFNPGGYAIQVYLAQPDGSYLPSASYPIGGTFTIALGDVNGDGKPDLIYAPGSYTIAVQLGNGDGTFQNPIPTTTPALNPYSIIIADFNKDGKADVALVDGGTNNVYVHLGDGNGTFQSGALHSLSSCGAAQVITADFNKDNKPDLAVACGYNGQTGTYVLLGNGDGTFSTTPPYPVGASGIATADLNKDNKLDLIVSDEGNQEVSVLLGNGDGTFQIPISSPVVGNLGGNIVTADFNGDGKLDIAMTGGWTGIVILLGNGIGGFKSPLYAYGNINLNGLPSELLVGDYNNDGKPDLAAASYFYNGESFSILTNNGDGSFGAETDLAAGVNPQAVVAGDFNGDGKLDLAVTSSFNGRPGLGIYLGKGSGTFASPIVTPQPGIPNVVVAGDFNHDSKLDLAEITSTGVSILLGEGNGRFAPPVTYLTGTNFSELAIADLNKDGNLDLVLSDSGDSNVTVLLGNANGTFQNAKFSSAGAGNTCGKLAVVDFNRDGIPDVALSCENSSQTSALIEVLTGNGDGTFQAPIPTLIADPSGVPVVQALAAPDLRGNGIADIVVVGSLGNGCVVQCSLVYLGNGDGTFQLPIANYGVGNSIEFADFNGDGKLDAAFTGSNSYVAISLGNGDGTFQPLMQYQIPHADANIYANSVVSGDFNQDGSPDLAVISGGGTKGYLTILLSNPVAVFSASKLSFGKTGVGSDSTLNLTVTNQSPTKLLVKSVTITGVAGSDYSQTNTCGAAVAPYSNCAVTVTFKPSVKGTRNATLSLADSAWGRTRTVALSGIGD